VENTSICWKTTTSRKRYTGWWAKK